ncbi:sigma-54-dependent Fis family transcriptional regulator [Caldinitratiruptor microaerophilus]|uniref:Sigma-54-dependent Fis family transcriptional regulator n=1 Tax=Caldinitratiruptor microaerophilus TaxID=671077 RepID=A0AA35G7V5_9FIRM|nr:sigma-54-dependent Fis family transcriptional regulator [Caldinitratiruptor microaerophilus]BDG60456.1 sigma-54-dependent Fis family transcriptional regulator [Caldinitratiruptor microaerophilus]
MRTSSVFAPSHAQVLAGWEAFRDGRELPPGAVRPTILRSWVRCRKAGLEPEQLGRMPPILDREALRQAREQSAALLAIAGPVLRDLHDIVRGTGFIIALTDGHGVVLEVLGDRQSLAYAASIDLVEGSDWSERVSGTNAMGLALIERRPVQVVGCEHYLRPLHILTCSAAPIFDAAGEILGVLDVTGPRDLAHAHTLGMVIAAARAVERQLRLVTVTNEVERQSRTLDVALNAMRDGMLVVDQRGHVLQLSAPAAALLGLDRQSAAGSHLSELFGPQRWVTDLLRRGLAFQDEEITLTREERTLRLLASARPIAAEREGLQGFVITLREAREVSRLVQRVRGDVARFELTDVLGISEAIHRVRQEAQRAAASDLTVLIIGESGTGKELLAHGIHNASRRRGGPFVAVNCGAIPKSLLESELFGYEGGAFTGADRQGRPGKFELADGGTLFLDEIGDMPLEMQASLLRVLQDRRVVRVGGSRVIPVDVRVIAATHRDLHREVAEGNFRADLLYRLDVLTIRVPPLRERPGDVRFLLETLIRRRTGGRRRFSDEAMEALCHYHWPGNVRELENVLEKCLHMAEGDVIRLRDLPPDVLEAAGGAGEGKAHVAPISELEREAIARACWQAGGNLAEAARLLGISRPTLYRKIRSYGIRLPRPLRA